MRVETALIFADVGNRPFHRPDRAGRLKVRHRSGSFPRREQYSSFRQIVQRFFAVPGCFCVVPCRSRVVLCGSPWRLCSSPGAGVQFPRRGCAVPQARVCSPRRGRDEENSLSQRRALHAADSSLSEGAYMERASLQKWGGALFASAGGGFVDRQLTGRRFAV